MHVEELMSTIASRITQDMSRISKQCDDLSIMLLELEARLLGIGGTPMNARLSRDEKEQVMTCGYGSRMTTAESEYDLDDWVMVHGVEVTDLK
jgi:hypothetical protein